MTTIPSRLRKTRFGPEKSFANRRFRPEKNCRLDAPRDAKPNSQSSKSLFWKNPKTLDLIELRFTPLKCSHKKLIHTIDAFPNHTIVTCDDDFMYHKEWLNTLYQDHLAFPNSVIAQQIRSIERFEDGQLKTLQTVALST